jgi:hypothetical protein
MGYNSLPLPRRVRIARRRGDLSVEDGDALTELYDRANTRLLAERKPTPECTLAQLAAWIGWTKSDSALDKLLSRLRRDGWLTWEVRKRKDRWVRIFTLHPERSEFVPSSQAPSVPSSEPSQPEQASGSEAAKPTNRSEFEEVDEPDSVPSPPSDIPSSEPSENGSTEPIGDTAEQASFRVPQTFRTEADLSPTGRLTEKSLCDAEATERLIAAARELNGGTAEKARASGPDENERGLIAAVMPLDAVVVDQSPCRYPSHRRSEWVNDGGRVVCGVCYPPVRDGARRSSRLHASLPRRLLREKGFPACDDVSPGEEPA